MNSLSLNRTIILNYFLFNHFVFCFRIILIDTINGDTHNFFITCCGNRVECIVLAVKLISQRYVFSSDISILDNATGTVGNKYITFVSFSFGRYLSCAHMRQQGDVFQLIVRVIETNVVSSKTDIYAIFRQHILDSEFKECRFFIGTLILCDLVTFFDKVEGYSCILFYPFFHTEQFLLCCRRVDNIYRELFTDRERQQDLLNCFSGILRIVDILFKIECRKSRSITGVSSLHRLEIVLFETLNCFTSRNEDTNLFTSQGIFNSETTTDIFNFDLMIDSRVLEGVHFCFFIILGICENNLGEKLHFDRLGRFTALACCC